MKLDEEMYWRSKWLGSTIEPQSIPESLREYLKEPVEDKKPTVLQRIWKYLEWKPKSTENDKQG